MSGEELLRESFVSLEVNEAFSGADLLMRDRSRLCFRHNVAERWAKAIAADENASDDTQAGQVLSLISQFRLNARHLEIQFADGSRWEARFKD